VRLLDPRKQAAHHRLDLGAGQRHHVGHGQCFVRAAGGEPPHLLNECPAEIHVRALRPREEAPLRPRREADVGLAGAQVALDLFSNGRSDLGHRNLVAQPASATPPAHGAWSCYLCEVLTLRCTRKLLDRLRVRPAPDEPKSTTLLGDWYANLLFQPGPQLVLLLSQRTLLPIVIQAAPAASITTRFPAAVADVLGALGIPAPAVEAELREMQDVRIGKTNSRQILGSMADFTYMLGTHLEHGRPLTDVSHRLAHTPCDPIGMKYPADIVREVFAAKPGDRAQNDARGTGPAHDGR
jgi:hypothetical protein